MASKPEKGEGKPKPTRSARAATTRKTTTTRSRKSKAVTYEMIAWRAYEIFESGAGGSEFDNWLQAERELKAA